MTQKLDIGAMRACEMLRVAAKFIRDSAFGGETIFYDDAECDGYCVADDCDAAADVIEHSHRAEILRLTAEVERLRDALEPFAEAADECDEYGLSDSLQAPVDAGACREARAALGGDT